MVADEETSCLGVFKAQFSDSSLRFVARGARLRDVPPLRDHVSEVEGTLHRYLGWSNPQKKAP